MNLEGTLRGMKSSREELAHNTCQRDVLWVPEMFQSALVPVPFLIYLEPDKAEAKSYSLEMKYGVSWVCKCTQL